MLVEVVVLDGITVGEGGKVEIFGGGEVGEWGGRSERLRLVERLGGLAGWEVGRLGDFNLRWVQCKVRQVEDVDNS